MAKLLLKFGFLFFVLCSISAFAVGGKVVLIDFKGLHKVQASSLKAKLISKENSSYSPDKVHEDINQLYKTGLFDDVSVSKVNAPGGVELIFNLTEKGVIGAIHFSGNKKIKDKDLLDVIDIREYNSLDEGRIASSIAAIEKAYAEKDLSLAEVSYEAQPLDTEKNEYELTFTIRENRQIKIRHVTFVGNKKFSDKKLRSTIKTKVKGFLSFLNKSGKYDDSQLKVDVDRLTFFYLNNGYLKVKIGKPQVNLTRDKQALYVTIPVYEGDQYTVSKIDVAGDILNTREELLSKLSLKEKEIYNRLHQEQDVATLTTLYGNQSYAFANIYPQINTNDAEKTATVTYYIEKGHKITIERIDIKGNTSTHDKVIRRELQIQENSPFNASAIEMSRRRLLQLGYFETVNFSNPRGSRDDTVVLVIEVKEKSTGTFSIGAGFSTLENFIFNASIQKDNFFGLGYRGAAMANISKLRQEFSLNVTDNYFLDTRWIVSANVYKYYSALNRDFDQKSVGGSLSFGREIFPFFATNLGYNIEQVSIDNFSSLVPLFFQKTSSGLTSSIVNTTTYDTRDNRLLTTKGLYYAVTNQYAGNGVGGDNDFWKITAENRYFFKLPLKSVLKLRGIFSYVNSLSNRPVPLFERFFLGGVNTLRGFDLNTIGPNLQIPSSAIGGDREFVYGGNRSLLGNIEYEFPIYDPAGFKAVVFFDVGQSYGETEGIDLSRLRSDYGFGFRWNSPFGPLRFEWGFPIAKRSGESGSVFNFTIGQSF